MKARPTRPKPLIPTVVVIAFLPCRRSVIAAWLPVSPLHQAQGPASAPPQARGQRPWASSGRAIGPWSRPAAGRQWCWQCVTTPSAPHRRPDEYTATSGHDGAARPAARAAGGPGRCASAAPCTSTCCRRATPAARPGRTSRPGWRTPRPAGMSRPGGSLSPTTRWPRSTAGSATTPARPPATGPSLDSAVSIHAVERFLGDLALRAGLGVRRARRPAAGTGCSSSARARAACRPPTISPGSGMRSRSGTPASGQVE